MSNPFDQFSSDLSATLPPQPPPPPAYGMPAAVANHPYGSSMGGDNMYNTAAAGHGYGAPPPPPAPPNDPYQNYSAAPPPTYGASNHHPDAWGTMGGGVAPPAPAPPVEFSYGTTAAATPYGTATPVTPSGMYGAPPAVVAAEPSFGAPPSIPTMNHHHSYGGGAESNPYAANAPESYYGGGGGSSTAAPDAMNPYGGPPPPPPTDTNPYGAPPPMETNPYGAPPPMESNPYGAGPPAPTEMIPYGAGPPAPADMNPYGAPPALADMNPYGAAPTEMNPYGAQMAPPPPPSDSNPYGGPQYPPPNPYGAPLPSEPNPYGAPPPNPYAAAPPPTTMEPPNPYGAPYGGMPPPSHQQPPNPYGADPNSSMLALVPAPQQSNPYAQSMGYGPPPPYGYGAPPPPPPIDPFSVFETQSPPAPAPAAPLALEAAAPAVVDPTANDDDFWGSFGPPSAQTAAAPKDPNAVEQPVEVPERRVEEEKKSGDDALPPGGEWYDARIFTPTLGVMFFKPQELTDSLYLNTDKEIIEGLGDRPVVAFIVEGSSARSASVELGHVLLKVNGISVKNPKEASRLIKEGPRPLPLVFYIPKTDVVISEGEHMVKYDSKETVAPNSAKDWKPKYVVIGGIISQPWMMNMYRSKSEYDIAVIETQARRPVSVKVKQFSLQGARIQNDWQGPQIVKYKNKLHPWKFICVLPVAGNPIKISSPNLSQLKPVHEGIRRVLLAQQRVSGGRHGSQRSMQGDPARDDRYRNDPRGNDSQYDNRRNHDGQDRPGHAPQQQQQQYGY